MKTPYRILFAAMFLAAPMVSIAQDAREIMIKVDDATNHSYSSSVRQMKFSTCRSTTGWRPPRMSTPTLSRNCGRL